jgi:hypothetical protein
MRKLAAPFLLFLLCTGFYWRLTLTGQYTFLDSPDLANLDLPRLQFQASAWRHSHLPLWDPYHWVGQPFLGQVTGAAYPANWLLGIFPFHSGKLDLAVVHWYLVFLHFQAALFCYFLCRDWKRTQAASVVGGLVFSLGGFLGTTDWPQILNGALWLPLILLFLFRALRGRRSLFSAAASGALLGITWLSGHHEVPIYATTAVGGIWLAALAMGPRRANLLRLAIAAALATALIAAVQILPAQEYAPLAKRWVGLDMPVDWKDPIPYSVHEYYAWSVDALAGIVTPQPPVHVNPFIGIVAFSLILTGVYHGWRRLPQVRLLIAIAAAGLVMALANDTFVHGLLYATLPVFGKARVPARALALFSFAAAPLAAFGFDALRRRSSPWTARTVPALAATAGLLLLLAYSGLRPAAAPGQPMVTACAAIAAAVLLAAFRSRSISLPLLLTAIGFLIVTEISNVAGADMPSRVAKARPGNLEKLYQHNDIASFLRAQPQPIRVDVNDADIPYNFGDWHGIPTLGGFAASATSNLVELERHKPRVQDMLGIGYYVAKAPPRPDLVQLTDSSSGLNVYKNPSAFPRAWTVHSATRAAGYDEIRARLDAPDFQPRSEALLLTPPPALEACPAEDASISPTPNPNRVRIDVAMNCRGLLILSDTAFPGWHATVDGRPVEILEPFGALRGIVVDKGPHHIEFNYRPVSAVAGAALTLLGIAFVGWTRWRTRKFV